MRACAGLLACCLASAAQAQTGDDDAVVLEASECPALEVEPIRELVSLELAPRTVVLQAQAFDVRAGTAARLRCAEAAVELSVHEPGHDASLSLTLDLTHTPLAAQPRLIALTLSELIVTSRMETQARAERPPAQVPEAESPTPPSDRPLRLWLAAGMARHGEPAAFAAALYAGLLAELGPAGVLSEVQGDFGGEQLSAGDVRVFTLSMSAVPALRARLSQLELFAGAGLRAGYAQLSGDSEDPLVQGRRVRGLWLGPVLALGLHVPVSSPLALHGGLELGYVAKPLRGFDAAGGDFYALEGFRLTLALGLALRP
jgi:hypothetical protein